MNRRYGFTLIELLVVIAIIAVLMAILMPALRSVRKQAAGSVCLSNQHQLVLAWIMYAQENDDKLVGGHDGDLYHGPGDRRHRTEMTHRSYGIPGGMNGDVGTGAASWLMQQWGYPSYKKLTEIKNPGIKYVFLEEKTDVGGWNWGSWNLEKQGDRWWDPIVVRHGQLSVLAFSDGHAIKHKWKQKSTLEMTFVPYPDCIRWPVTDGTDDLQYMRRGYNPAR